jgi:hypothetical protein
MYATGLFTAAGVLGIAFLVVAAVLRGVPRAGKSVVAVSILVSTFVGAPAVAATSSANFNFVSGPPNFCANADAEVNTNTHLMVSGVSLTTTRNDSSCGSFLNWPSGAIAARVDYFWGGGLCDQSRAYTYNPAPYQSTAYQQVDFAICGVAGSSTASIGSDSFVLVGYPAAWQHGYEQTSYVVTT